MPNQKTEKYTETAQKLSNYLSIKTAKTYNQENKVFSQIEEEHHHQSQDHSST